VDVPVPVVNHALTVCERREGRRYIHKGVT